MRFVELFLGGFYGNSGGRKSRFVFYFFGGFGSLFENFCGFFLEVFQAFFSFLAEIFKHALMLGFYLFLFIVKEPLLFNSRGDEMRPIEFKFFQLGIYVADMILPLADIS